MSIFAFSWIVLCAINLLGLSVVGYDKMDARRESNQRIPEGVMFCIAICFGGIGILAGMFIFRHKTQKWYFLLGIPVVIIQNLYVMTSFLNRIASYHFSI